MFAVTCMIPQKVILIAASLLEQLSKIFQKIGFAPSVA